MAWSETMRARHETAVSAVEGILGEAFRYLRQRRRATERETQAFILSRLAAGGLTTDGARPIVAFRENTAIVHYFPERPSLELKHGSVVLIDVWARLKPAGSPYADLTWMGYCGRDIPGAVGRAFRLVLQARAAALAFLRMSLRQGRLPAGAEVDRRARQVFTEAGYGEFYRHGTGHSLGTRHPHGPAGRINPKNKRPLLPGWGYTIEPGLYLPGKFGCRSEMNIYIDGRRRIIETSVKQRRWRQI